MFWQTPLYSKTFEFAGQSLNSSVALFRYPCSLSFFKFNFIYSSTESVNNSNILINIGLSSEDQHAAPEHDEFVNF